MATLPIAAAFSMGAAWAWWRDCAWRTDVPRADRKTGTPKSRA